MPISGYIKFLLLSIFASCGTMISSPIFMSIPLLEDFFSNTDAAKNIHIILTMPALGFAVSCIPIGILVDKSKKFQQFFRVGCLISVICGIEFFFLRNVKVTIISRFILGIAFALLTASANAYVRHSVQKDEAVKFATKAIAFRYILTIFCILFAYFTIKFSPFAPFLIYSIFIVPLIWFASTKLSINILQIPSGNRVNGKQMSRFDLCGLAICYLIVTINAITFFVFPSNLPYSIKQIGLGNEYILLLAASDIVLSILASMVFKKMPRFSNLFINVALLFCVIGISTGMLCYYNTNIYHFLTCNSIGAFARSLLIIHLTQYYVSRSSQDNMGLLSSIFAASVFFGTYIYSFLHNMFFMAFSIEKRYLLIGIIALSAAVFSLACLKFDQRNGKAI